MGNFVSQIDVGSCKSNNAETNSKTNGQAMVILLISFVVYIVWNFLCWTEYSFKMCKKSVPNTSGIKLLGTASLAIMITGAGSAVTLVTCFTQPVIGSSFVISLSTLISAVSFVSAHGLTEYISLIPDAIAIGINAYVIGIASSKYTWERVNNPVPNMYIALGIYAAAGMCGAILDIVQYNKPQKTTYAINVTPKDTESSSYLIVRERLFCTNSKLNSIKVVIILFLCCVGSIVLLVKQALVAKNTIAYLNSNPLPAYNSVYIATPIVGSVAMSVNFFSAVFLFCDIVLNKLNVTAKNIICNYSTPNTTVI
mmetsp:Transcript_5758/g.16495  ORF Transcript_5758/g.16495 Transcript_5758/m.16495 type:complete len:311 (+) Transcript_5758:1344-2276(+)